MLEISDGLLPTSGLGFADGGSAPQQLLKRRALRVKGIKKVENSVGASSGK